MKNGKGVITYFNEKYTYDGEFLNDKKHGEGIVIDDKGNKKKVKFYKD